MLTFSCEMVIQINPGSINKGHETNGSIVQYKGNRARGQYPPLSNNDIFFPADSCTPEKVHLTNRGFLQVPLVLRLE